MEEAELRSMLRMAEEKRDRLISEAEAGYRKVVDAVAILSEHCRPKIVQQTNRGRRGRLVQITNGNTGTKLKPMTLEDAAATLGITEGSVRVICSPGKQEVFHGRCREFVVCWADEVANGEPVQSEAT